MEQTDFKNVNSNFGIPFGRLSNLKTSITEMHNSETRGTRAVK
jgi:hypothetical protein